MTETLFSAPHMAMDEEVSRLRPFQRERPIAQIRADEEAAPHDRRWTGIYDLYHLRGDAAGMAHARAQIQDPAWAAEIGYRDIYTTEEMERLAAADSRGAS